MRRRGWWTLLLLLIAVVGSWIYWRADADQGPAYRFATVERGDIEATVSATGALSAVTTVQVGTQVSGQVSAIYADFNDEVKKGQLLARIDPVLHQQAVEESLAGVQRAQAQFDAAKREYERNRRLFEQELLPESELTAHQSTFEVAQANLTSARVALERARRNLGYTSIFSPIDGVVVERNVDVGQTVAASLQAPQLFLIANDLSRMQILASVDESDIGAIVEGQPVRFTVPSYPDHRFVGAVRQVRLQSTTTENVVSYTVVVEVENDDGRLLPGMTATLDFLTNAAHDVLLVPNAALRFRPSEEMLAQWSAANASDATTGDRSAGATRSDRRADSSGATAGDATGGAGESRRTSRPSSRPAAEEASRSGDAARAGRGSRGDWTEGGGDRAAQRGSGGGGRSRSGGSLWYLADDGKLATLRVRTGLSDGVRTEVSGRGLVEGMQVIVGFPQSAEASGASGASPFQSAPPQGGPRWRGPGGF